MQAYETTITFTKLHENLFTFEASQQIQSTKILQGGVFPVSVKTPWASTIKIEPLKAWHDLKKFGIHYLKIFQFHFYLSLFHTLRFMSILAYIFCIVCNLGALGVTWKIQVMASLQIHDFFMTCSWPVCGFRQPIRGCSEPAPNWRDGWS